MADRFWKTGFFLFLIFPILYQLAQINYLFFHTLVEVFSVVVSVLIYVLATRTYRHSANNFLLFLGVGYFFVAILNFLHLSTYYGLGIFPDFDANPATQLWIVSRALEAVSFFIAASFITRKLPQRKLWLVYGLATVVMVQGILVYPWFPDCYVDGIGLTKFKIISEYAIVFLMLAGVIRLQAHRKFLDRMTLQLVSQAIVISVITEIIFTGYGGVYDNINFLGHILVLVSRYLLFEGVVLRGLETPYDLIFAELKAAAITDSLTGVFNRQGFKESIQKEMERASQTGTRLGLLYIDIDNFKGINDRHGHNVGDQVLYLFTRVLRSAIRRNDFVCRVGGDEFVIVVDKASPAVLKQVRNRIRTAVGHWRVTNPLVQGIDVSIGCSIWSSDSPEDIDSLLTQADQEMYKDKCQIKGRERA